MSEKILKKVQIIITTSDGYTLLLKTTPSRGDFWQSVTGGVEISDKDFFHAAIREVMEETGIEPDAFLQKNDLAMDFTFFDTPKNIQVLEKIFHFILPTPQEIKLDPHEHETYKWLKLSLFSREDVKYEQNYQAISKVRSSILKPFR